MKLQFEQIRPRAHESFFVSRGVSAQFECPYHFHPELELTYIEHGHGTRVIGGHLAHFEGGDLMLIGSNVPHWYDNNPSNTTGKDWARWIVLQFQPNCIGDAFLGIPETRPIRELFERAQNGLHITGATNRRVVEQLTHLSQQSGYTRLLGFLNILGTLTETPDEVQALPQSSHSAQFDHTDAARMDKVFRHLNAHFREPIRLETIAQLAGMTPPAFSRFYKQKTGTTFQQTLIETRLLDACQELITTERSISEICFACGFNSLSNFNRQFKRNKELSPKAFRNQWKTSQPTIPPRAPE